MGPRQTGKTTLLGQTYPDAVWLDLLKADTPLSYWRLASGIEVDFVIGAMQVAIEVKATARVTGDDLRGLRQLAIDQPRVGRRLVVCLEPKPRRTDEGIEILPATEFVAELASGKLFGAA